MGLESGLGVGVGSGVGLELRDACCAAEMGPALVPTAAAGRTLDMPLLVTVRARITSPGWSSLVRVGVGVGVGAGAAAVVGVGGGVRVRARVRLVLGVGLGLGWG